MVGTGWEGEDRLLGRVEVVKSASDAVDPTAVKAVVIAAEDHALLVLLLFSSEEACPEAEECMQGETYR